ncbi:L,D-transpeptidase [Pseudahrensia aquimaris]|uniref:L,D-transpeptidase n=1 Tax=Pseudahrensia aquimaris TaxID=744461 RepID=A0ABW3FEG2_9HYPH
MDDTNFETDAGNPSRRAFILTATSLAALTLAGCARRAPDEPRRPRLRRLRRLRERIAARPEPNLYPALLNEQFPIDAIPPGKLPKKFHRQRVPFDTAEKPGTVIVDTGSFYLYHVEDGGTAMRYGVGLGRQGFEWSGRARIAWKRAWPTWTPPEEMIKREPDLAKWSAENGGMPPGLDNPLGARALYIFQDGKDTLYRLHGTPEIFSIGKAVSSGCVRLVNHDIIHLYDRVRPGSAIIVR